MKERRHSLEGPIPVTSGSGVGRVGERAEDPSEQPWFLETAREAGNDPPLHLYQEGPHPSILACPMATFPAGLPVNSQ